MKSLALVIATTLWVLFQPSAFAQWTLETNENEMDGTVIYWAESETVPPTKPLSSPYDGTVSMVKAICVKDYLTVVIDFTRRLDRSRDGLVDARLKFDNEEPIEVSFLHSQDGEWMALRNMDINDRFSTAQTVLLELPTYSLGLVYFRYPLGGAAEAISNLSCTN